MYLDLPQANSKMYIEPQLGAFRPQYVEPQLAAYTALGATNAMGQALDYANSLITPLPAPVVASIKQLPLTSKQKSTLIKRPVSFFVIFADASQDKVMEFVKRTHQLSGRKSNNYRISGVNVSAVPKKGDPPAMLAAQFLTVANMNPVAAMQVAGAMMLESGSAIVSSVAAGVVTGAQQAVKGAQQIAQQTGKFFRQFLPFGEYPNYALGAYTALGDPVTAAGAGAAAGATAATATAAGITSAQIVALTTAAIGLAGVIVPPLIAIVGGVIPQAPPPGALANAPGAMNQANQSLPPDLQVMQQKFVSEQEKILGLPRNAVIGGGAVVGIGLAALIIPKLLKK